MMGTARKVLGSTKGKVGLGLAALGAGTAAAGTLAAGAAGAGAGAGYLAGRRKTASVMKVAIGPSDPVDRKKWLSRLSERASTSSRWEAADNPGKSHRKKTQQTLFGEMAKAQDTPKSLEHLPESIKKPLKKALTRRGEHQALTKMQKALKIVGRTGTKALKAASAMPSNGPSFPGKLKAPGQRTENTPSSSSKAKAELIKSVTFPGPQPKHPDEYVILGGSNSPRGSLRRR